jgi:polysaccharide pyruvyl transferase WcaK-like protein
MMIGMRLHSIIMGASEKCACFALSYDPKVTNLMQEVGIEGYELATLPNNPDEIAQRWLKFYRQRPTLSDNIIESLAHDALKHQSLIDLLIA